MSQLLATGVGNTGGKYIAGVVDTGAMVSKTSAVLEGNFAAGVVETGGKFARCPFFPLNRFPKNVRTIHFVLKDGLGFAKNGCEDNSSTTCE